MRFRIQTLFLFLTVAHAQIHLPKVFDDNMVLQRDIKIPLWGNATPESLITAEFGDAKTTAKADQDGKWTVHFPKFKAGGPYTLKIYEKGKQEEAVVLNGVLIGDVWLASGQSNMEWQVQQAKDASVEIANANFPQVRFLIVEHSNEIKPQKDISTNGWNVCDSNNVKELSAVAYFFGRKIYLDQNVPVEIIQSTWGGMPIEVWTSREMLLTSSITRESKLRMDTLILNPEDLAADSLSWVRIGKIVYNPLNNADKVFTAADYHDADRTEIEIPNVLKDFGIGYCEGMACAIDIGETNDIHSKNKQEVGRRMALIANKMVYEQTGIASSLMYKTYQKEGSRIRIRFTEIGSGLTTRDGKEVENPEEVRYAWADNPECNLISSEGLPAGLYFYQLKVGNSATTRKMIFENKPVGIEMDNLITL